LEKLFGLEINTLAISLSTLTAIILMAFILLASRNRVLLKLALRNIPRRKAQTALIIVGLMLSTTIIMAALGIGDSINKGIRVGALYALGETDIRLTSPIFSSFGDNYINETMVEKVRAELEFDNRVDGIMPLIREQMPVINELSNKTIAGTVAVGVSLNSLNGFDYLIVTEEKTPINISKLRDGETIINKPMADQLEVNIGDQITLVSPSGRSKHQVIDISEPTGLLGGTQSIRASAAFPVKTLQKELGRQGYNLIEISVKGDYIVEGVTHNKQLSEEVTKKLKLTFIDSNSAKKLFEVLKKPKVYGELTAKLNENQPGRSDTNSNDKLQELISELDSEVPSDEFKLLTTETSIIALIMGLTEEIDDPKIAELLFLTTSGLVQLNVDPIKNRSLALAELISSGIVLFFTIFGSFSIIVGLLLIFLVFVMLASSRTTEMGIARAIGTKRIHLVQMFTYEGLVYSIGASIVGTGLGLLASVLLMQIMIRGFADSSDITFFFSVTFQSILIAFSAGFVLTTLTVVISAYRISKLNIVVAIRGLKQEFIPDETLSIKRRGKIVLKWTIGPISYSYETWKLLKSGYPIRIRIIQNLGLLLIIPWIIILIWKLFRFFQPWLASGWPLLPIGLLMALAGLDPEKGINGFSYDNNALFTIGITLVIVSIGLMIRRFLVYQGYREEFQKRVSMTLIGLTLLVLYGLPFDTFEPLTGELDGGPEMFILMGVSLVAAAVWVVMHNAEVLVWFISKAISRWGSLRPVVKMAIAYPMSARLRTGLTLAMFSLVIFTMMIFAILINLGSVIEDNPDMASGGFDIRGTIKQELPIDNPWAVINSSQEQLSFSDFEVISSQARVRIEAREDELEGFIFKRAQIKASDEEWLTNNTYTLTHWDPAYGNNSQQIWAAVAKDPTLAVIGANLIREDDGWGPPIDDSALRITGINRNERGAIKGVDITIRPPIGQSTDIRSIKRKVIGVLGEFADSFEGNGTDIYMHHSVLTELSDKPIPFVDYKFRLTDPSRASEVTRLLETVFIEHGMTAVSIEDEIEDMQRESNAFNQLFQGFMGLGLLVGVAALGVIAFRAVVERRQSIGMMRAIGYKGKMIQLQFLMESAIVAVIGSLLGVGLGTLIAWNIFKEISKETPSLTFSVPFTNVIVIILIAMIFSLINTIIPARQASKISPAESLRYE